MINCIVIDDDQVSIKLINHFVANTEGLHFLSSFSNPIEAANFLRKEAASVDLIFLDVEMPEMSGIELLEAFDNLPPVILITTKEKYAVKAFEHKVLHYLVKPLDYAKFLKAMDRFYKNYESKSTQNFDYIFIKENGLLSKIMHQEIRFCEALGDYVKIHVNDKTYIVNSTMKNVEEKLKLNTKFLRIHRSYIINLDYLENLDADTAVVGGKMLPIGSKFKLELQKKINII
jgi:DNA-binding LytR/AlgR family response regulator